MLYRFNYTILGHHQFEVFPYGFLDHILVGGALKVICTGFGNLDKPIETEFVAVCGSTALNRTRG